MAEYPALPLWTDAYLADTGHLSEEEHGIYLLLLMHMWRAPDCRLPNDDAWLARRFRRPVDWIRERLRPIIEEFMRSDGNWIAQKRLAKEYRYVTKKRQQRTAAAKSRWHKEKPDAGACAEGGALAYAKNDLASIPHSAPEERSTHHVEKPGKSGCGSHVPTPTPLDSESPTLRQNPDTNLRAPDKQSGNGIHRPSGRRSSTETFDEFWSCWDIQGAKRDKAAARRKYDAAIKAGIEHETLCGGVRAYMAWAKRNRVEIRFIKHPSTWLSKGCWSDELPDRNQESTDEWADRLARETADEFGWGSH